VISQIIAGNLMIYNGRRDRLLLTDKGIEEKSLLERRKDKGLVRDTRRKLISGMVKNGELAAGQ